MARRRTTPHIFLTAPLATLLACVAPAPADLPADPSAAPHHCRHNDNVCPPMGHHGAHRRARIR